MLAAFGSLREGGCGGIPPIGYRDPELLRLSEFNALRGNAEFEQIAELIRAKVAPALAMR